MPRSAFAYAAVVLLASSPAVAQQAPCLPDVATLAGLLAKQYGERLTAAGVESGGNLVQVYANTESGTWTIVVSIPNGPTCIVASGESWASEPVASVTPGRSS